MTDDLQIHPKNPENDNWIPDLLRQRWGSTEVISRGVLKDASQLSGFVACQGSQHLGLVTYKITKRDCEIVTLDSLIKGMGIGTALIETVLNHARDVGCRRAWLVTTNDNLVAIRFYQVRGFRMAALRPNVIAKYRELKPIIPFTGLDGIPIRDEIEFEIYL